MTDRVIHTIKGPITLVAWGPDPTGFGTFKVKESTVGQPVEDAAAQAVEQDKQVAKETAFVPAGTTPDGDTVFKPEEAGTSKPVETAASDVNSTAPVPPETKKYLDELQNTLHEEKSQALPSIARREAGLEPFPVNPPLTLMADPMKPGGVDTKALMRAQHLYIRAQQAYTRTKELHVLAGAQDDYIEALTTALEEAGVL